MLSSRNIHDREEIPGYMKPQDKGVILLHIGKDCPRGQRQS
jgi:hypothetical protein